MKWLKWVVAGILAVVVVVLLVVYFNLSSIVRRTVETQANASLNVPTKVDGASVSLFGGSLGLDGIAVGSPQGFTAPQMFTLDDLAVKVSYGELRQDPVTIDRIVIDKPKLVIEQKDGKFNFKALMDQQPATPDEKSGETLKLIVRELQVNNAHVALQPGIPGLPGEIGIPIPSFTVSDIGTGEGAKNGAAVKEIVMLLVTTMAGKAAESDKLPPEVQLLLKGDIKAVAGQMAAKYGEKLAGELTKNLPPEIGGVVGGALDAVKKGDDPGKAIEQGLKGLLDKRDRKGEPATQPK